MTKTIIISGLSLLLSLSACSGAGHSGDKDLEACSNFANEVALGDPSTVAGRRAVAIAPTAFNGMADPDLIQLQTKLVKLASNPYSWEVAARSFAFRCDALSIEREWGSRWSGVQTDRL